MWWCGGLGTPRSTSDSDDAGTRHCFWRIAALMFLIFFMSWYLDMFGVHALIMFWWFDGRIDRDIWCDDALTSWCTNDKGMRTVYFIIFVDCDILIVFFMSWYQVRGHFAGSRANRFRRAVPEVLRGDHDGRELRAPVHRPHRVRIQADKGDTTGAY